MKREERERGNSAERTKGGRSGFSPPAYAKKRLDLRGEKKKKRETEERIF